MTELQEIVDQAIREKNYAAAANAWIELNEITPSQDYTTINGTDPQITAVSVDGISGHLGNAEPGTKIHLLINGNIVNTTSASQQRSANPETLSNGFRLPLTSLWKFLGNNDTLEVHTAAGEQLKFPNGRRVLTINSHHRSRASTLLKRLQKGFFVSKKGKLVEAFNSKSTHVQNCMDTFYTAHGIMLKTCGRKLFPICGTLLGTVRDQDFIPGDTDLDTTFVSPYADAASVKNDFLDVAKALRKSGYKIAFAASGMRVFPTEESARKAFSIMLSWRRSDDHFEMSYGRMGERPLLEWPMKFVVGQLGAFSVDIPVESEALLRMSYGEGWRIPDPGFSHAGRVAGDRDFLFSLEEREVMEKQLQEVHISRAT